ncbi:MAG: LysM peptidoglycan-binding domain-containing protein, partial [Phycisphaerae bacterium]
PDEVPLTFVLPFEQTALAVASQDVRWDMRFVQPNAIDERSAPRTHISPGYSVASADPVTPREEMRLPELVLRHRDQASRDDESSLQAISSAVMDRQESIVRSNDAPRTAILAVEADAPLPRDREYRVVAGDNLHRIVEKHYGSYSRDAAQRLIRANPALADDPDLLRIGQRLVIPQEDHHVDSLLPRASTYMAAAG